MIIPDINLLIYAYDQDSPFHARSAGWWQQCLSGDEPVGLLAVVLLGFVRISTNPRAFQNPMTPDEATRHVHSWLEQPPAELIEPGTGHVQRVLDLLKNLGTAGNLVTDAQIAASALEHKAVVHTSDTDFLRFAGLRWFNPLTGQKGSNYLGG